MKAVKIPTTSELFDLSHTIAAPLLSAHSSPEGALSDLREFILCKIGELTGDFYEYAPLVLVSRSADISPTAEIRGPTIIGAGTEVRHNAYIRGNALIGEGAIIGNSTEIKGSIIFDGARLPHYNYAGDSIVGYRVHLGAGAILSNLRLDGKEVIIRASEESRPTGRRKLGSIIGDMSEIGCGAVLCPGTVVGRESRVYPLCSVRGVIPSGGIYDGREEDR